MPVKLKGRKGNGKGKKSVGMSQSPSPERVASDIEYELQEEAQPQSQQDEVSAVEGTETQSQSQCHKRKPLMLNEAEEEEMAEWVCSNDIFYDKSKKDYKDTTKKSKLWQDKAQEMGHAGDSWQLSRVLGVHPHALGLTLWVISWKRLGSPPYNHKYIYISVCVCVCIYIYICFSQEK